MACLGRFKLVKDVAELLIGQGHTIDHKIEKVAPNPLWRSQLLLLFPDLLELCLLLLVQLLSQLLRDVLLEVLVCVESVEVDLNWDFLRRSILIDEKFQVGVGADELGLPLYDLGLRRDFGAQLAQVLHHPLHIVLHKIDARLFQLLKLLQIVAIFAPYKGDLCVDALYRPLVCLGCYLGFVLNSHAFLADLLHFARAQSPLLVLNHGVLDRLLLLNGLLFEIEESVAGIITLLGGVSE